MALAQYKPAKLNKQLQKLLVNKDLQIILTDSNDKIESIKILENTDIEVTNYPFVGMITASFKVVFRFSSTEINKETNSKTYLCHLSKYRSLKWNLVSFEVAKQGSRHEIKEFLTLE